MRINKFVAQATGLSRRAADAAIAAGDVAINGLLPEPGQQVAPRDLVTLKGKPLNVDAHKTTIMLNKPVGYVCSRDGQGSKTVYDLLPKALHHLKPVGRLDKDSSGLLLMTNDGNLAHKLTHPSFVKSKTYEVTLDKPIQPKHVSQLTTGVILDDGSSVFDSVELINQKQLTVVLHEGRNRQIRRTFSALLYTVKVLHRISFGTEALGELKYGEYKELH